MGSRMSKQKKRTRLRKRTSWSKNRLCHRIAPLQWPNLPRLLLTTTRKELYVIIFISFATAFDILCRVLRTFTTTLGKPIAPPWIPIPIPLNRTMHKQAPVCLLVHLWLHPRRNPYPKHSDSHKAPPTLLTLISRTLTMFSSSSSQLHSHPPRHNNPPPIVAHPSKILSRDPLPTVIPLLRRSRSWSHRRNALGTVASADPKSVRAKAAVRSV